MRDVESDQELRSTRRGVAEGHSDATSTQDITSRRRRGRLRLRSSCRLKPTKNINSTRAQPEIDTSSARRALRPSPTQDINSAASNTPTAEFNTSKSGRSCRRGAQPGHRSRQPAPTHGGVAGHVEGELSPRHPTRQPAACRQSRTPTQSRLRRLGLRSTHRRSIVGRSIVGRSDSRQPGIFFPM